MSKKAVVAAKGTAKTQRVMNSLAVLDAVRRGPKTVTALCEITALSRTAVEAVVRSLVALGWVSDGELVGHSGRGRPARVIALRSDAGLVMGIDIGSHSVRVVLADLAGEPLAREHRTVEPELGLDERLDVVASMFADVLSESGRRAEELWVVAVGTTGVVRDNIVTHCDSIPGLEGVHLGERLERLLGRPVVVDNDCNLAAVAERWKGTAADVDELVYVLAGPRVGAGLVLGGELYRGWRGGAGEIGALRELEWVTAHQLLEDAPGHPDGASVFDAARQGDPDAADVVERYAAALAKGISALILTLDPQMVVVGGGVSHAGRTLLEPLHERVAELSVVTPVTVVFSDLGDQCVSLGALRLGLDAIERRLARTAYEREELPSPSAALLDLAAA